MRFQITTTIAFGTTFSFLKENADWLWGDENPLGAVSASVTEDGRLNFVAVIPNYGDDHDYGLNEEVRYLPWNVKVMRLFFQNGWELLDVSVREGNALRAAIEEGRL